MISMKVGHVNGKAKPKRKNVCMHGRVVDYHYNDKGQATGNVVCRECGAIIPDSLKV